LSRNPRVPRAGSAAVLLLAAAVLAPIPSDAAVAGSIIGRVIDGRGVPQMGATVLLLNAEGRALHRIYTNDAGGFTLENLFPGVYGVRVNLASFLPAIRENILVAAGAQRQLQIQMSNLFSSIQLVYPREGEWRDMSEDWKWVLRTASATRPVLRLAPWEEEDKERRSILRKFSGAFGPVQGLVQLSASAGDGGRVSAFGSESDLGTAFAVATSLFGSGHLLVSGNLGYGANKGAPSMGFHTSYRGEMPFGAEPEISVTVRQLFRPLDAGRTLFGPRSGAYAELQALTLGFQDHVVLGDLLRMEYGFRYDSVSFLDRLNYISPFGKLTYSLDEDTHLALSYAGGVPRPEMLAGSEGALAREVSNLGLYPRLSVLRSRPRLQRGEHIEIGLHQKVGQDVVEVAAYRDSFSNTAVTALLPGGLYAADALPDLFANTSSFNAGSYRTTGYRVSYSRRLNDHVRAAVAYGRTGVLAPSRAELLTSEASELRAALQLGREHFLTARVTAQAPKAGTWITSTYQWMGRPSATAPDLFNTSDTQALPGMNLMVRQPLPELSYLPGKFEATAEFRNMLAQNYIPVRTSDGRRLYLIPSARSFRGGFNFVF